MEQIDGFFLKTDSGQYYAAAADGADFDTRGIELWKKSGDSTAAVSEEPAPSAVHSPESAEAGPAAGTGLPVTNDAEAQAESQSLPENTDSSDAYNDPENVMYSNTFHKSGDDIPPDTFRDFDTGLYFDSFSDPDVDIS